MNTGSKISHQSSIGADLAYTSYEWSLSHWSLLYDHYTSGVSSPEFQIVHGNICKCVLTFYPATADIHVNFLSNLEFHTLQVNVSIVDTNMKKLLTAKSARIKSLQSPIKLRLPGNNGEAVYLTYAQNDTLTLLFELNVVQGIIKSPVKTNTLVAKYNYSERRNFQDMVEAGELCDVTLVVEKKLIRAHKLILAANSEPFRAAFLSPMKEQKDNTVEIEDVEFKVFMVFLNYMYTNIVDEMAEVAAELIVLADRYQVIDLIKECETFMVSDLQIKNATQYLITAHRLHLPRLEAVAIEFMKRNIQILADPAEYRLFSDYPSLISRIFE